MSKNTSNHTNQCNPNNSNYQGYTSSYTGSGTRSDVNNHSNQMNPNTSSYSASRGEKSGSGNSKKWKLSIKRNEITQWMICRNLFLKFNVFDFHYKNLFSKLY